MAENKEELKSLLMKVKEESEKADLKLNFQRMKIMVSGPISSWQIDGEAMETERNFFLGSKVNEDGDCSHEIKTLAPCKKNYEKPRQHIKKQRHYFVNTSLFSQMYGLSSSHGCESWTKKKAECQRIDTFVGDDFWESLGLQGDPTSQL